MSEQILAKASRARYGYCRSCGSGEVVAGGFKAGYMKPYLEYRLCLGCGAVWFHALRPERAVDLCAVGVVALAFGLLVRVVIG